MNNNDRSGDSTFGQKADSNDGDDDNNGIELAKLL